MVGCLQTSVRKQSIIALYFEFEPVLEFYNLEDLKGLQRSCCMLSYTRNGTFSGGSCMYRYPCGSWFVQLCLERLFTFRLIHGWLNLVEVIYEGTLSVMA